MSDKFYDAWKKLKITEEMVTAAEKMSQCAPSESQEKYWSKCVELLNDLRKKKYEWLTQKVRNWVHHIKTDLSNEGLI